MAADELMPAPDVQPMRKPVEEWAQSKGHGKAAKNGFVPDWRFAAAKAFAAWPQGFEALEAEYDRAIADATSVPLR